LKIEIPKEELEELYLRQRLSCRKIGKLFGLRHETVKQLLDKNNIHIRSRSEEGKLIQHPIKYVIPKENLEELYWKKQLSLYQIAGRFGCSPSCIFGKMKKYNIHLRTLEEGIALSVPRRSQSIAVSINKYAKKDFDGSDIDRAYLIGFRLGDLWVGKNKYGKTIFVSSATSKNAQLELMRSLFEKYGKISEYKLKSGCTQFVCNLNLSFDFLLPKEDKIPEWVLADDSFFSSFLAGYVDAEGHFGIDRTFAEFAVKSYDLNILSAICKRLNSLGINCREPRRHIKAGFMDKRGVKCHRDLYGIKIARKQDLLRLINRLKPYVKHAKRFNDMLHAEENITERNKRV
jgi:intein-encoded DNA endonuclease-like protein